MACRQFVHAAIDHVLSDFVIAVPVSEAHVALIISVLARVHGHFC